MEEVATSEKVSVNVVVGDLAKIDILVDNGFYSSRSDFIQKAVMNQLKENKDDLNEIAENEKARGREWGLGILSFSKKDLEKVAKSKKKISIVVYGVLHFDSDITLPLAMASIESLKVHGKFNAAPEVKAYFSKKN
jgi:hypothetical protein